MRVPPRPGWHFLWGIIRRLPKLILQILVFRQQSIQFQAHVIVENDCRAETLHGKLYRQLVIGGDILVESEGRAIRSGRDIISVLEDKRPGEVATFVYYRGDSRIEEKVTLVGQENQRRFRF